MSSALRLNNFNYTPYLTFPENLPRLGTPRNLPPIPDLFEPACQPDVTEPSNEPLVLIEPDSTITPLHLYHRTGWPDSTPYCHVRETVYNKVAAAENRLPPGYGLAIMDGWRPLELQQHIYAAARNEPALPENFVSEPSTNPATPPPHLTGGTIDATLTWRGTPLALGTGFDDFTPLAHTRAYEYTDTPTRNLRRLLYHTMRAEGLIVLDCEWWHFEYGTRRWAAINGSEPLYGATQP